VKLAMAALVLGAAASGQGPAKKNEPKHAGPVSGLLVLDGKTVASSSAGIMVESKGANRMLDGPGFRVFDLAAHGEWLVAVGGRPGQTGEVSCIGGLDREVAHRRAGSDVVYAVAISAEGRRVVIGLADGSVFELGLPKLDAHRTLKNHSAACRAVACHGDRLVTAGLDGNLILYDRDREPRVIAAHTAGIDCLMFTADGERVLSGARDGRVRLHSFKTGRLLRSYQGLGDRTNALCADPIGDGWLVGLRDGQIVSLAEDGATIRRLHRFETPVHALRRDRARVLVGLQGRTALLGPAQLKGRGSVGR